MTAAERWVWVPFEVDKKYDGFRIDRFLSQRLAGYSRSRIQRILAEARVLKEERPAKPNTKVRAGEKVQIAYLRKPEEPLAQDAALPVLYEDDDLLIVNKPPHLLSHPTDKIVDHTILGVLRHSRKDLGKLHLLHRLDRETSGVLALAKNPKAARGWTQQMESHRIRKEYVALMRGLLRQREGKLEQPIGRHGGDIRVKQWVNTPDAVDAVTEYRVVYESQYPPAFSMVRAVPRTGRLHQIRVHFAAMGHPLLGDPLYSGDGSLYKAMTQGKSSDEDRKALGFPRVALHAASLTFLHPGHGKSMRVEAPLPEDMASLISDKLLALT